MLSGTVQSGSTISNIKLSETFDEDVTDYFIRLKNKNTNKTSISKIKEYDDATQTVILYKDLKETPQTNDIFTIDKLSDIIPFAKPLVKPNSTKSNIILDLIVEKDEYKDYWIKINDEFRQISSCDSDIIILTSELSELPKENDIVSIYRHVFNDYIILGVDFTNIFGIDLSNFINILGGAINFQITSVICIISLVLFSSISISILFTGSKNNVVKNNHSLQPIIIQMPMQTRPYSYNDSPFPRST